MDFHFEKTAGLLCSGLIPRDNHGSHGPQDLKACDHMVRPKCQARKTEPHRMEIGNQKGEMRSRRRSTQNPRSTQWTMWLPLELVPALKHCAAVSTIRRFLK